MARDDARIPEGVLGRAQSAAKAAGLELVTKRGGLALTDGTMSVSGDFTRMLPRLKPANLNRELLVRAAKAKTLDGTPRAIDATAGLGEDALLLAAAGFEVMLFERNEVVAALLHDTLLRAREHPELSTVAERMRLIVGDSIAGMRRCNFAPDVVLLDPMFPAGRRKSAAKKKLQLLQRLEEPCADEVALLEAAIAARPRKVIVKRPVKGACLAGRKPDYALAGKAVRYDCLVAPF